MINIVFIWAITRFLIVFSVQNAATVTVALFLWKFETSLTVLLLAAVLVGIVIAQLIHYRASKPAAKPSSEEN